MKRLLLSSLLLLPLRAPAQPYSIDWHRIAGGGGTSTNSQYSLTGTIGQHDATAPISGGSYSIHSGYWSLFAVQTLNAPLLRIFVTNSNIAVVFWPSPSSGWHLRQTASLPNPAWSVPAEPIQDDGTNRFVIVNSPVGTRFYRLSAL